MTPPPFPEGGADIAGIVAPSDVIKTGIIDGDGQVAGERLASGVGQFDIHFGLAARAMADLVGKHLDLEDFFLRRHEDFSDDVVHLAIDDGISFDKEVRHVGAGDREVKDGRLALQTEHDGRLAGAVDRPQEDHDRTVGLGCVDGQAHGVPGGVFGSIRNQFKSVIVESQLNLFAGFADGDDSRAFDGAALGVGHSPGQAVLAWFSGIDSHVGSAVFVRSQGPFLLQFFDQFT